MRDLLKRLYPYIKPFLNKVILSILFSFGLAAIKGFQVRLVQPMFDKGLSPHSSWGEVIYLAGMLFFLGIVNFPIRFFHFYWIRFVVDRATCTLRTDIFTKLQKLPMSFYSKSKQGQLISNILNDTMIFSQGFRNGVDLIREPVTAIIMLGLCLYYDWLLTGVVLAVTPLFLIIFIISGKKIRVNQGDVQQEISDVTHSINEGISGQKISKAFNLQNYILSRFEVAQNKYFNAQMRTTFVEEFAHPLVEFVGAIAFSGVIIFAHYRIRTNSMTVGDFLSFITALALLMDPIRKFSQANVKLNQARAAGDRIFEMLELKEEVDLGKHELKSFNKKIEVKNVTFSYGEGEVIKNLSLTIEKGEKIALVGLSGSGKSTLINLLLGLYNIDSGEILIDGVSISEIKLESLRKIFSLVSQDVFLFHDTIRENLTIGNDYSEKEIDCSLQVAYAAGFINDLPMKKMTIIGDRGTRLSGGQGQRLTIARAFLRNPDIFLFDEATSSLDNESEKVVQKALEGLAGGKTVIAIAHRLSTIQDFDRIYVLKEGCLIEQGNHRELIDKNGEYAKLYELSQKV